MQQLLGRADLLEQVRTLLSHGHNVLLFGPPDVGKSAIIHALDVAGAIAGISTIDPFARIAPHRAGEIRRAMDLRGAQFIAATRSLDRGQLGAVRRIAWRFTNVRVLPLADRPMRQLIENACVEYGLTSALPADWSKSAAGLASGRPGVALSIVGAAAEIRTSKGRLPSPNAAFVVARMKCAGLTAEIE